MNDKGWNSHPEYIHSRLPWLPLYIHLCQLVEIDLAGFGLRGWDMTKINNRRNPRLRSTVVSIGLWLCCIVQLSRDNCINVYGWDCVVNENMLWFELKFKRIISFFVYCGGKFVPKVQCNKYIVILTSHQHHLWKNQWKLIVLKC